MNTNRVRELLRKKCDAIGGQRAWAREHGVSIAYVSYVLNGKIEPGWKILDPLGLERRPADYVYRKGKANGES